MAREQSMIEMISFTSEVDVSGDRKNDGFLAFMTVASKFGRRRGRSAFDALSTRVRSCRE